MNSTSSSTQRPPNSRKSRPTLRTNLPTARNRIMRRIWNDKAAYLMLLPVLLNFIIFHYLPMYGIQIAFKDYSVGQTMSDAPWVGFKWFQEFFKSRYFFTVTRNTLVISLYTLVLGTPLPIMLAMLLNEVKNKFFKKVVQSVTYMPHFISTVIVIGMVFTILSPKDGIVNQIIRMTGNESIHFLEDPQWFTTVYMGLVIWRYTGFDAIIYFAAISGIDQEMYEASIIDGAGRFARLYHITFKSIMPTVATVLILRVGKVLNVAWQEILLLQNDINISRSEVIQTFVYKRGLLSNDLSYAAAVGLLMSVISFVLIVVSNRIVKKLSDGESSLF